MFIVTFRRRASRTWRNRLSTALRVIAPTQDETLSQRVERHLARITSSSWLGAAFQRYEITACIRWLHGPAAQRSETTAQCAAWKSEVRGNRTGRGWFKKGQSGNPSGLPKTPPVLLEFAPHTDDPDGADRRTVGNLVVEARRFSGLAVDTLVELTKNTHTDSTRYTAPTALLDRGYGRPVVPISSANRSPWTSTFRLTR
jgi:hypothetical protein